MESVQNLVASAIAGIVRPAPLSPEKVMFAWRVSVGPALARLTHVALRHDGVLDVLVNDARWLRELERSSPMVLERLRDLLGQGEVRRIELTCPSNTRSDRRRPPKPRSR
jgi:predicted nucleic acid-binding Zn ribbon protein